MKSASLFVMAQGIGFGNPKWITAMKNGTGCYVSHQYTADDIVVSGNQATCHYKLRVERGRACGRESQVRTERHDEGAF